MPTRADYRSLAPITLLALLLMALAGCEPDHAAHAPAPAVPAAPSPDAPPDVHTASFTASPAPRAGEPTALSFVPRAPDGTPVRDLDEVHEALSHLIIVSEDLRHYDHVHAGALDGEGAFTFPYTFPHGGRYVLFVDYTPSATGTAVVTRHEVEVAGPGSASAAASRTPSGLALRPGGVRLRTEPERLPVGDAHLTFSVMDDSGQPARDLEPHLGTAGHLVVIDEGARRFLHAHPLGGGSHGGAPSSTGPDLAFHAAFPEPGRYRAWVEFRRAGAVEVVAFDLDVAARGDADAPSHTH